MTTQTETDQAALIARIAQQDESALSELYDRYGKILYAVAFKMLGTVEEAEETVLDVFHQVWRTAQRYDATKARVDTWLFMQLRSRAIDKLRIRERMTRTPIVSLDAVEQEARSLSVDPSEEIIFSERRTLIQTAIRELPPEQQQVLELAYFQGWSHTEISTQTGIPLGTIKTRIRLGLTKLRGVLASLRES
ncbi:sigma-70 family RNA polymerase sigma factor [Calothrix sp. 336/3]|uniref:sigma-70 family RNA polymerase sigma factor n=1 Tax=Calothrix sp. 336/3 TaxID=1337936 RepID=UPI0004E2A03F|nr:sigma-70 family RNA polymerase sigma factor [Calothrix sp. 336/3]AKG20130.1 hypothetical protein IJ00_01330 [Calothrix sp. 336/3]